MAIGDGMERSKKKGQIARLDYVKGSALAM